MRTDVMKRQIGVLAIAAAAAAAGCGDVANVEAEQWGALGYLLRNADPLNAVVIALLTYLLKPVLTGIPFFAVDRNRLLVTVPLILGMLVGYAAEFSSRGLQPFLVFRRGLAAGAGAVALLWLVRVFFHASDGTYQADVVRNR
jgi:hypothetical protein